jgi:hypothetical protein
MIVEKMINYHYKDAKAAETKSRLKIEHLDQSNFNLLLLYYNEFILATSKRRDGNYDIEYIRFLCKLMNAPKIRREILDQEFINEVKDKAFESLMFHINFENCLYTNNWLTSKPDFQKKTSFKAYICRGNNGRIVKQMLK